MRVLCILVMINEMSLNVLINSKKEFTLRPYNNWQQEADNILKEEKCDIYNCHSQIKTYL
jgi:cbb3-type cytochrome oxidase cytochrome c subunit